MPILLKINYMKLKNKCFPQVEIEPTVVLSCATLTSYKDPD